MNLANTITHRLKYRKWIATYDNANVIKAMYAGFPHAEFELRYSLQEKRFGNEVIFIGCL